MNTSEAQAGFHFPDLFYDVLGGTVMRLDNSKV